MGRRSYSGEKRRKELARKAKRDAKLERKQQNREGEAGGGPPIDWDAQVGGPGGAAEPEGDDVEETEEAEDTDDVGDAR
jgi:hypothetical protein